MPMPREKLKRVFRISTVQQPFLPGACYGVRVSSLRQI